MSKPSMQDVKRAREWILTALPELSRNEAGEIQVGCTQNDAVMKSLAAEFQQVRIAAGQAASGAQRILESLTPGGSEFAGDPDACATYIRKKISTLGDIAKDAVKRQMAASEPQQVREFNARALAEKFAKQVTQYPNELREWREVRWETPSPKEVADWFEKQLLAASAPAQLSEEQVRQCIKEGLDCAAYSGECSHVTTVDCIVARFKEVSAPLRSQCLAPHEPLCDVFGKRCERCYPPKGGQSAGTKEAEMSEQALREALEAAYHFLSHTGNHRALVGNNFAQPSVRYNELKRVTELAKAALAASGPPTDARIKAENAIREELWAYVKTCFERHLGPIADDGSTFEDWLRVLAAQSTSATRERRLTTYDNEEWDRGFRAGQTSFAMQAAAPAPAQLSEEQVRELAELVHVEGQNRCAICFWPLAVSGEKGCVRRNCSMRGKSGKFEREAHRSKVEAIFRVLSATLLRSQPAGTKEDK